MDLLARSRAAVGEAKFFKRERGRRKNELQEQRTNGKNANCCNRDLFWKVSNHLMSPESFSCWRKRVSIKFSGLSSRIFGFFAPRSSSTVLIPAAVGRG